MNGPTSGVQSLAEGMLAADDDDVDNDETRAAAAADGVLLKVKGREFLVVTRERMKSLRKGGEA